MEFSIKNKSLYVIIALFICQYNLNSNCNSFFEYNQKEDFNISDLYKNKIIIKPIKQLGNFSLSHSKKGDIIKVISQKKIGDLSIKYIILYKDKNNLYNKESFYPGDENFVVQNYYFVINGKQYNINRKNKNINNKPVNIWYSEENQVSIKYYNIEKTKIILIHGINLYCNGNQCVKDKIFSITITFDNKITINEYDYNRISPYQFSKIELLNNEMPYLYLPKNVKKIRSINDFEVEFLSIKPRLGK